MPLEHSRRRRSQLLSLSVAAVAIALSSTNAPQLMNAVEAAHHQIKSQPTIAAAVVEYPPGAVSGDGQRRTILRATVTVAAFGP